MVEGPSLQPPSQIKTPQKMGGQASLPPAATCHQLLQALLSYIRVSLVSLLFRCTLRKIKYINDRS